jgi:hypothetical protein
LRVCCGQHHLPHSLLLLLLQGKGNASTVEELDALMHEIGSNKERYEKMLAWKHKKVCSCWQLWAAPHADLRRPAGLSAVCQIVQQPACCCSCLRQCQSTLLSVALAVCELLVELHSVIMAAAVCAAAAPSVDRASCWLPWLPHCAA